MKGPHEDENGARCCMYGIIENSYLDAVETNVVYLFQSVNDAASYPTSHAIQKKKSMLVTRIYVSENAYANTPMI